MLLGCETQTSADSVHRDGNSGNHRKHMQRYFFFLAVLGLRYCAQAFSSCGEQGQLFIAVRGLLIAVASLVAEHGL